MLNNKEQVMKTELKTNWKKPAVLSQQSLEGTEKKEPKPGKEIQNRDFQNIQQEYYPDNFDVRQSPINS
jgi:hypothetical protein